MTDSRPSSFEKHPCNFCGAPCYHVCYIGHRLACVRCFERLAVIPALKAEREVETLGAGAQ